MEDLKNIEIEFTDFDELHSSKSVRSEDSKHNEVNTTTYSNNISPHKIPTLPDDEESGKTTLFSLSHSAHSCAFLTPKIESLYHGFTIVLSQEPKIRMKKLTFHRLYQVHKIPDFWSISMNLKNHSMEFFIFRPFLFPFRKKLSEWVALWGKSNLFTIKIWLWSFTKNVLKISIEDIESGHRVPREDPVEGQNSPDFNNTRDSVLNNTHSRLNLQHTQRYLQDEESEVVEPEEVQPQMPNESMITVVQNK